MYADAGTAGGKEMNPMDLFQLKDRWHLFSQDHAALFPFFKSHGALFQEGTRMTITITSPQGETASTDLAVTQNDLDSWKLLHDMFKK
jgi:hypothetical protein